MGIRRVHRQVCRRLRRRLNELGLETLEQYRGRLESDAGEWIVLDNLCHITISRFWRDKAVFDALGNDIFRSSAEPQGLKTGRWLHRHARQA
jgi:chemotaxis protein methyltransferase CheR